MDSSDKTLSSEGADPWEGVGESDEEDMLLFMGFPSVKDPTFQERFPGKPRH